MRKQEEGNIRVQPAACKCANEACNCETCTCGTECTGKNCGCGCACCS